MTNKEAANILTNKEAANILTYQCRNYSTEELHMAFDLAIKALEEIDRLRGNDNG